MSKIKPLVTTWKNTIRKEKTYDVLYIQRENGNGTKRYSKKAASLNKQKEKRRNTWGYRGACSTDRRTFEQRAAASTKA